MPKLIRSLQPIIIVVIAIFINSLIILAYGFDPVQSFTALLSGSIGGPKQISETFVKTCPLLLTGLAVAFAFRCGVWNIGAEGQFVIGTLIATWIGTSLNLPKIIFIPIVLSISFVAGGLWGTIAGLLKAYRDVAEVISTIMLNFIAIFLVSFAVDGGPLQEASKAYQQSDPLSPNARLPILIPRSILQNNRFHLGILISIAIAIFLWWLLFHTTIGFQVRAVGQNQIAAKVAGISVPRNVVLSMMISGGLAGLAGAIEISALSTHCLYQSPPGYGYTAIAVALLGQLHPIGVIFSATLFGILQAGSEEMQMIADVPSKLTWITQAVVLLLVLSFTMLRKEVKNEK